MQEVVMACGGCRHMELCCVSLHFWASCMLIFNQGCSVMFVGLQVYIRLSLRCVL